MGLRDLRVRAGVSVNRVAAELGVTRIAVYQWERGESVPSVKRLGQIARIYGCTVDEIVKEVEANA